MYISEKPPNFVIFQIIFSIIYALRYQSKIIRVIKKKRIKFLFIAVIYFPLSNILTLFNNCCVILTTYMLDSALEPSYN